jgi:hypothetical protein
MVQAVLHPVSRQWCYKLDQLHHFTNAHLHHDDYNDHVTLFHPSQMATAFPIPLRNGDTVLIHPVGIVQTSYVAALVVVITRPAALFGPDQPPMIVQADGRRLLHITLGCADGVRPVASNDAIANQVITPLSMPDVPVLRGTVRRVRCT